MRIVVAAPVAGFVCALAQVKKQRRVGAQVYRFRSSESFHGKPATHPRDKDPKNVRSAIREAAAKGRTSRPLHHREWGCGSGCMSSAVVDAVTQSVRGAVQDSQHAFPEHEGGHEYQAQCTTEERLFIADGCPERTAAELLTSGA